MNSIYQIIPRKYRPQRFKNIVGQDAIVSTLKNALLYKRLGQAYLFCGCKGTGKTTTARLFAKALNCAQLTEEQEPCNQCPSCIEIANGNSLDVLEIDGASNRGIDDIRQINETVGYAPAYGKYKIYIVDEVHMLTKEAFNALLKTLEEPPAHVKFFFATTEPHKVLPTIVSRCQRFDLARISPEAMREKLLRVIEDLNVTVDPAALDLLIQMSDGSLRDAESLLDQLFCYEQGAITLETVTTTFGITPKSAFLALDEAVAKRDLPFAFAFAEQVFTSGKDLNAFMDALVEHYRSILKDLTQTKQTHPVYTAEQCLYLLEFLTEWGHKLSKTPFKQVGLEIILLHLIRSSMRISIDSLVYRLLELEKKFNTSDQPEKTVEQPAPTVAKQETILKHVRYQAAENVPKKDKNHYETLMRFAAVELEGITQR
jgi:DNA polymerase-3 subunit gamma/tau